MKPVYLAGLTTMALAASANAQTAICASSDGVDIKTWMQACDSVASTAAKCANAACHTALHRLEEEETHECWEFLNLGLHGDFAKYIAIDAFCHGEGPDPETTLTPTTKAPTTATPSPKTLSTPGAPSTPSTPSTPSPNGSVPTVTPKPQC